MTVVLEAHRRSKGTCGARRISEEIEAHGVSCGRDKARTLRKLADVPAKQKRKFKVTTDSKYNLPIAPNLLNREFKVKKPDRDYVSDITYIWTNEERLYLAIVHDLYSRLIVGWSLSNRMSRKLIMDAVRMAVWRWQPAPGLLFHSGRGSQYCCDDFQKRLKTYEVVSGMSRKKNCWDNSVAESFLGYLKTERIYFTNYVNRDQAKKDIVDCIEMFYNSRRRHSYLGYVSPRGFEKMLLKKAA